MPCLSEPALCFQSRPAGSEFGFQLLFFRTCSTPSRPFRSSPRLSFPVRLVTANDVDMCAAAATDAGVVTEYGGGGGGRKEEGRRARRKREGETGEGDGQRGQRVDNGPEYDNGDDDERARS